MKLLLDTHVMIWAADDPAKLGGRTTLMLEDLANEISVSSLSTLEIGQLVWSKRLAVRGTVETWVRRALAGLGARTIDMTHPIAALAYALPGEFHKDPADRVLVATAIEHGLTLVTADERILAYPHAMTLDARA